MNWFSFLTRSKGTWHLFQRMSSILSRYGLSSKRMSQTLYQLNEVLESYQCSGTFPITAIALSRHPEVIRLLAQRGMEFAIHGYVHVDHSQLSAEVQREHLDRALTIFKQHELSCQGFRSPYLHWNSGTLAAIKSHALLYQSNPPILWEVLNGQPLDLGARAAYQRVIDFYAVKRAAEYLSIPRWVDGLVCIPVALPDDEMLVERLRFRNAEQIKAAWCTILDQTYARGELFTLSLHPERTAMCHQALAGVLAEARSRQPAIWIAQLRDIATWWCRRQETQLHIREIAAGKYHLQIQGPEQLTVLTRGLRVEAPTQPWVNGYQQVLATQLTVQSPCRPFIGVSPAASAKLVAFLREWGYWVEINDQPANYELYFDQETFDESDEKPLVDHIENSRIPLIRLGLWPAGARSALAITGDIDALTLWDFGLRLLGA